MRPSFICYYSRDVDRSRADRETAALGMVLVGRAGATELEARPGGIGDRGRAEREAAASGMALVGRAGAAEVEAWPGGRRTRWDAWPAASSGVLGDLVEAERRHGRRLPVAHAQPSLSRAHVLPQY